MDCATLMAVAKVISCTLVVVLPIKRLSLRCYKLTGACCKHCLLWQLVRYLDTLASDPCWDLTV
jgi:hypothetical protein